MLLTIKNIYKLKDAFLNTRLAYGWAHKHVNRYEITVWTREGTPITVYLSREPNPEGMYGITMNRRCTPGSVSREFLRDPANLAKQICAMIGI
jgi:hypothetical protein